MNTIWKFELYHPVTGVQPIQEMPAGARVLCVDRQDNTLCLWAMVDEDMPKVTKSFRIIGTGHVVPGGTGPYIGSVVLHEGQLVLHVFHGP